MSFMRRAMVAGAATAVGLIGAGVLGPAAADVPPPGGPRTVSMQGVGIAALDQGASDTGRDRGLPDRDGRRDHRRAGTTPGSQPASSRATARNWALARACFLAGLRCGPP